MKGANECARRVKQFFKMLRAKLGKVGKPSVGDPVQQMILGILTRDMPESKAREALERLNEMVVDYNELRVISPLELTEALHDFPDAKVKAEDLSRALNRVFAFEHAVSMERLEQMSQRDARQYLDKIDGLEAYTRARIRLLGLGQHAIPLDEAMWALVRKAELVDPKCSLEDAQAFLERQISADDALEFVALLRKHAWAEMANAVRKGEVERIRAIPPDRTSRNMLQPIYPAQPAAAEDAEELELAAGSPPAGKSAPRKARSSKARPPRAEAPKTAPAPTPRRPARKAAGSEAKRSPPRPAGKTGRRPAKARTA